MCAWGFFFCPSPRISIARVWLRVVRPPLLDEALPLLHVAGERNAASWMTRVDSEKTARGEVQIENLLISLQVQEQEEGFHESVQEVARRFGQEIHREGFQKDGQVLQSHQDHLSYTGEVREREGGLFRRNSTSLPSAGDLEPLFLAVIPSQRRRACVLRETRTAYSIFRP